MTFFSRWSRAILAHCPPLVDRDLILRLTCLFLVLHSGKLYLPPFANAIFPIFAAAVGGSMLAFPSLLRNRVPWLILCLGCWTTILTNWNLIDNHLYLIGYWLLACTLSTFSANPDEVLRFNARFCLGLSFLFAVLWKFLSHAWLDGSFFYMISFFDPRIGQVVKKIIAPSSVWSTTLIQLKAFTMIPDLGLQVEIPAIPSLVILSRIACYGGLTLEILIVSLFLFKRPCRLLNLRDYFLVAFCLGAYLLAPVYGFAYVFSVMGLAQCESARLWTRLMYVLLFCFAVILSHIASAGVGQLLT